MMLKLNCIDSDMINVYSKANVSTNSDGINAQTYAIYYLVLNIIYLHLCL